MPAGIFYIVDTMKQGPWIDCGKSRLRSALKIAGGSLSGGGSLGGPSLYILIAENAQTGSWWQTNVNNDDYVWWSCPSPQPIQELEALLPPEPPLHLNLRLYSSLQLSIFLPIRPT